MTLSQRYKINKDQAVHRIIAGEAVMLQLESGYYYSLDKIGTEIWKALDENKSVGEIIDSLKEAYDVSDKRLENDVWALLKKLEKAQLIKAIKD
ncbi:MAG: PqqD family protein [Candidatus Omnitrophica bacterium]|nr:PqqD family protein [Candidatus Omnitrophota bacterium]MDD5670273.1 PqqD family protein [Candidatus Omnitrophota bacterium]